MSSDTLFKRWLEERIAESGMSRAEFAAALEVSEAAVYSWLAPPGAQHHRGINARSADRIAQVLGVHPNEVREVAGLPKKRVSTFPVPSRGQEGMTAARVYLVPVIGVAPADSLRHTAAVGEMIAVPASHIHDLVRPQAVIVSGDCLAGRNIRDGDYLIIDSIENYAPNDGDVVIVRVNDEMTAKEWRRVGERVLLIPTEPGYAAIELPAGEQDDIELIGVARSVMSVRNL